MVEVQPAGVRSVLVRSLALGLALTTLMPWITSRGLLDASAYIGNPFPLIDWFVFGAATAAAVVPRLAKVAVIIGGVSIMLTLVALSVDLAEGLSSSLEHGLVLAALASAFLWVTSRWHIATAFPPN